MEFNIGCCRGDSPLSNPSRLFNSVHSLNNKINKGYSVGMDKEERRGILEKASSDYLSDKKKFTENPYFQYNSVKKRILVSSLSIVSFVFPDGSLGLFVGRLIRSPIPFKYRRREVRRTISREGLIVVKSGLFGFKRKIKRVIFSISKLIHPKRRYL